MDRRPYKVDKTKQEKKRYPSDLSDAEWLLIEPHLRQKPGRGRKRSVNIREVVNAIFYMNRTGCQWRFLPKDFPDYHIVEYYFRTWSWDGTLERINTLLREQLRVKDGKDPTPSLAIIDAQSVKTTEVGGDDGFDGGKKSERQKTYHTRRYPRSVTEGVR
jgi:putative transposase